MPEPTSSTSPTPTPSTSTGQGSSRAPSHTSSGPGRVLVAVYAVFALAASARAVVQIATNFHEAPVAYLLSGFSAAVYVVATVALARGGTAARRVAWCACTVEFLGVVTVGIFSLVDRAAFPDATVWSVFGRGYAFIPLVLPIIGLLWLRRTGRARRA
ncbi:hypothetical protein [Actinopolymorpha pittospori]|uniref:Integral membrane protein n=1 Tax=Actinopolymorpha pittospori TaxID=648752 RepID=A0A927RGT1_9ACTN|nr:hypothetical protein [Actinopolymorpha pittospori]